MDLGNLYQIIDDFDFGPILFNGDAKDMPNHAIMSGYQYKILNNKLNIVLDLVTSSSSATSHTSAPIIQESLEKMFVVHEGHVKNDVENCLAEV